MINNTLLSNPQSSFSEELNSFTFPKNEIEITKRNSPSKKEKVVHKIESGICKYKIRTDIRNILQHYIISNFSTIPKYKHNELNINCECHILKNQYFSLIEQNLSSIKLNYHQWLINNGNTNSFLEEQASELTNYIYELPEGIQHCTNSNKCAKQCLTNKLQTYINSFEGNLLINHNSEKGLPHNTVGISCNENSINSFLSNILNPIYEEDILEYEYYDDFIDLVMSEYFIKELTFHKITHPLYPDFINISKAKLYSKLLETHKSDTSKHKNFFNQEYPSVEYFKELGERFDNDIYSDINAYRNKKYIRMLSNYSPQQNFSKPLSINKTGSNNKKNYIKIIRTLYTLTNGDITRMQQLAKLMAQIYLGENACKHFGIRNNKVTLLKTNNTKFLNQFFFGLFNFVLEDPIYGYSALKNTEIAIDSFLNDWISNGGVNVRNQKLPHKKYRNIKSFYHISKHSMTSLTNNENAGKFIEDKLYGNVLNVSIEPITDGIKLNNFEKLLTIDKNTIKRKQSLLGPQSITLNCKYVFITNDENSEQILSNHDSIDFDFIRLSEDIDEKELIFKDTLYYPLDENSVIKIREDKEAYRDILAFNQYEKYFMSVDFPLYGLNLLLCEEVQTEEELSLSIDSSESEFLDYFIKNCCETPEIDKFSYYNSNNLYWSIKDGTKSNQKPKCKNDEILDLKEGYMVTVQLLKDAFEEFYKKVTNHKSTLVINKDILPNYITAVKNQRVPDEVRVLLETRGYNCTNKGTSCYLGIGLLPQKDILGKAKLLKAKLHQDAPVKPTIDEFADFIFSKIATPKLLESLKDTDSN